MKTPITATIKKPLDFHRQIDELYREYDYILGQKNNNDNLSLIEIVKRIVNYYEGIINYLPGNVYWFDKNCIGLGANKNVLDQLNLSSVAEYRGMDYEEIGRRARFGKETAFFKQQSLEVISSGEAKLNIQEPAVPDETGKPIFFLSSRVPLYDHDKNIIGVAGISIDITELRQTQQELKKAKEIAEQASQAKSEFIANMSHDIKTPLAGIIGLAELLSYRLQGDEHAMASVLLHSGRQLLTFIESCLQIFKLETNNIHFTQAFDLRTLLMEIKDLFEPSLLTKQLSFTIKIETDCSLQIIGSRESVFQILSNLISNAVKFTEKGGITIVVKKISLQNDQPHASLLSFSVIDTGIGIPQDKQYSIFEKFTRLTPSYKGIYEGHGIGLYIVDKLVKAMNGNIAVVSEEQRGSTFTITIPVEYASQEMISHKSNAGESVNQEQEPAPQFPLKILIVEDHPIAQLSQSTLLSSMGHTVTLASNGEDAIKLFSPGAFDLIFMDVGLPGIQGDTASKLIREKEKDGSHTPIIALTAHLSDEMGKSIKVMGVDLICKKPLSREKVYQLIKEIVDKK
jgi:signal transduction histidine kinase